MSKNNHLGVSADIKKLLTEITNYGKQLVLEGRLAENHTWKELQVLWDERSEPKHLTRQERREQRRRKWFEVNGLVTKDYPTGICPICESDVHKTGWVWKADGIAVKPRCRRCHKHIVSRTKLLDNDD
jgi:hypothetical protein